MDMQNGKWKMENAQSVKNTIEYETVRLQSSMWYDDNNNEWYVICIDCSQSTESKYRILLLLNMMGNEQIS